MSHDAVARDARPWMASDDRELRSHADHVPRLHAVRGATTVERDEAAQVHAAVLELLEELMRGNGLTPSDVVSVIFTATDDLHSVFPARAARELTGWDDVPMLCARELDIDGALPRCIRVLMHVQTDRGRESLRHAYLREAIVLRPDLTRDRAM